jgi:acetoin utilization protein AcuB
MSQPIERFMTRTVHTIGASSSLSEAHRVMNEHSIRHLPVLEAGRLVGMVSQRDLHLVETLQGVRPQEVTVEEAMSQDVYAVAPDTELAEVAHSMATHKYGSAVVLLEGRVQGIFTTVDALVALEQVLAGGAAPPRRRAPARKPAPRTPAKTRPPAASAARRAAKKAPAPRKGAARKGAARKGAARKGR